ncbi:hypothetical protein BH11GEM1_BH11GEM1_06760 [soil metagenome]
MPNSWRRPAPWRVEVSRMLPMGRRMLTHLAPRELCSPLPRRVWAPSSVLPRSRSPGRQPGNRRAVAIAALIMSTQRLVLSLWEPEHGGSPADGLTRRRSMCKRREVEARIKVALQAQVDPRQRPLQTVLRFVAGSPLLDPAGPDWRWDPLLREARQGHRPASVRGQGRHERHGGTSLRGARTGGGVESGGPGSRRVSLSWTWR